MQKSEQDKVKKLEWMLNGTVPLSDNEKDEYIPPYGDVTELNSCRLIMDYVGAETLKEIGENAIKLLDTSVAIYEANGDYAFGMFSSGWCRLMDSASRELCKTDDNREALSCGKWRCHENCWNDSAKKAIETGRNTDIECVGGIHLYAEPIYAGQKVIGAINIGYGDPPKDPDQLKALAVAFGIDPEKLKEIGESYRSRPTFIIDVTKQLLGAFARLIGEIVEKAEAERKQKEAQEREVHVKNVLKAVLDVNQLIVKENDPHHLIQKACENLTGTMGYFNAWIALLDKDGRCVTQTGAAVSDGNFEAVRDNLNRGVFPACMQRALETSELEVIQDLAAECHDCPLASSYGGRAALAHRLEHEGAIFGVLSVSTPAQFAHDTEEQDLFLEVSNDLAFALSKIEKDKELQLKNQIIQTTPQPMAIVSGDYRYLVVNQAYCRVYGTAPENITGRAVADFISPAVFEQEIRPHLDRCLTGEPVRYEIQMDFPGTGPCWMRMEYTPYRDKDNRIVGVVSHGLDITARKRAEDELRMEKELSDRIIEDGPVAITLVNRQGKIVFANRHAEQLFGLEKYSIETLGYNDPEWLITDLDGSPFPNERLPFNLVMSTGQPVHDIQHAIAPPAAARKILSINGAPLHDEQGRIDRVVFAIQDITARKRAEEELRENERELQLTLDATADGIWSWNFKTNELYFSPKYYKMLGYEPDEFPADFDNWLDLIHPDDREEVLNVAKEFLKTKPALYENEFRLRTKSCDYRWVRTVAKVVERDENGDAVYMIGNHEDITERKLALDKLIEERERFDLAIRAVNDGLWDWNLKTNEIYYSPVWKKILGYEDHEIKNEFSEWERLTDPKDVKVSWEILNEVLEGKRENFENEFKMLHKDGHWVDILARANVFFDEKGKGERCIGTHVDITERKKMEEALRLSEAKFRLAFKTSPDSINLNRQEDGVYIDINNGFTKIMGYHPEEVIGKSLLELNIWKNLQDRKKLVDGLNEKGFVENLGAEFVSKNGDIKYGLMSAAVIEIGGEKVILSITRDITERKQIEQEREKLQTQLTQAQKMESVGRLAGGVAHDFNNMLGIILGHADMILEEMEPHQPFHANLTEIRKAGERSADLTRQLLAFARKQTVAPKVLDLNKTVEGMLKMLHRLIGEDIDMAWIPGEKVWPVKIDPAQIDQVLANLCVNARDAIADVGKVTIETGNTVLDEEYCKEHAGFVPGEYTLLTVSDNGCGMNSETLENVFEPFFTTKESDKGTGLGLSTVYGAVKQNNGFINVYSEPGQGTTFRIYLPRHRAKETPLPDKEAGRPAACGHETILLVEDEPAILRMTRMMLERTGYKVLAAGTPGEAIAFAREHAGEIHLLMTDVVMPEMNGRDLAKNLLSLYPDLKRLFMSGYTANVIAHHGVLDEGVSFIQKPFSKGDLAAKVREVLDKASDKTHG